MFIAAFIAAALVSFAIGSPPSTRTSPPVTERTYQGETANGGKIYCDRVGNCEIERD